MADVAPLRVSPFIRGCRWIALTAGIGYGVFNYNRLSRKEAKVREIESKRAEELAIKQKAKKNADAKAEMLYLAKETGTPVPADFDAQFK